VKVESEDKEFNKTQSHLFKRQPSEEQLTKRIATFSSRHKKLEINIKNKVGARAEPGRRVQCSFFCFCFCLFGGWSLVAHALARLHARTTTRPLLWERPKSTTWIHASPSRGASACSAPSRRCSRAPCATSSLGPCPFPRTGSFEFRVWRQSARAFHPAACAWGQRAANRSTQALCYSATGGGGGAFCVEGLLEASLLQGCRPCPHE